MSESCYFCGEDEVLDEHHIVPRRFDGSDNEDNLVNVCPSCHRKLENLYDKSFYESLGIDRNYDECYGRLVCNECEHQFYRELKQVSSCPECNSENIGMIGKVEKEYIYASNLDKTESDLEENRFFYVLYFDFHEEGDVVCDTVIYESRDEAYNQAFTHFGRFDRIAVQEVTVLDNKEIEDVEKVREKVIQWVKKTMGDDVSWLGSEKQKVEKNLKILENEG